MLYTLIMVDVETFSFGHVVLRLSPFPSYVMSEKEFEASFARNGSTILILIFLILMDDILFNKKKSFGHGICCL